MHFSAFCHDVSGNEDERPKRQQDAKYSIPPNYPMTLSQLLAAAVAVNCNASAAIAVIHSAKYGVSEPLLRLICCLKLCSYAT